MGQDERIVVHVHNPAVPRHRLGDLMRAIWCGQAGADVEELADTCIGGQVANHASEECPVGPRTLDHLWTGAHHFLRRLPVRREMIFPAEPEVIDACGMRHVRIESAASGGNRAWGSGPVHRTAPTRRSTLEPPEAAIRF
jgi:hypothetical protein